MNKCGDCTACCSIFSIPELGKPIHQLCKNNICNSCIIYKTRPKACIEFVCAYIHNNWPVNLRPDKSGVVLVAYKGKEGYEALRIKDKVSDDIWDVIKRIKAKNKNVIIKGIDARKKELVA